MKAGTLNIGGVWVVLQWELKDEKLLPPGWLCSFDLWHVLVVPTDGGWCRFWTQWHLLSHPRLFRGGLAMKIQGCPKAFTLNRTGKNNSLWIGQRVQMYGWYLEIPHIVAITLVYGFVFVLGGWTLNQEFYRGWVHVLLRHCLYPSHDLDLRSWAKAWPLFLENHFLCSGHCEIYCL